jgi:DNA-binding transcriptional ArsR family regulator
MSHETPPIRSPEALRTFAHPVRLRLYEALMAGGPATAARLAQDVPGAPGSLSYHLRQLAAHGFIEEAPELAVDGRERVWRAVPGGARWAESDLAIDDATREISNTAQHVFLARQQERLRTWLLEANDFSPEWRSAAFSRDIILHLSPEEMSVLGQELDDVIDRWVERSRVHRASELTKFRGAHSQTHDSEREQRETVIMVVHGFPAALREDADGGMQ